MILAAGLGTRMRPLTLNCPKPLLKVAGVPLIEHHIKRLVDASITDIIINHAYLGDQIESYLKDGRHLGANIVYSPEPADNPLETGGGILQALPLISPDNEPFLVVNGDVWLDFRLGNLIKGGLRQKDLAKLVLVDNPDHNPDGDFYLTQDGQVVEQSTEAQTLKLTFSGVSLLSPELFAGLKAGPSKLAPLLRKAIEQNRVSGLHHQGYWLDVGTPERLTSLEQYLSHSHEYE